MKKEDLCAQMSHFQLETMFKNLFIKVSKYLFNKFFNYVVMFLYCVCRCSSMSKLKTTWPYSYLSIDH